MAEVSARLSEGIARTGPSEQKSVEWTIDSVNRLGDTAHPDRDHAGNGMKYSYQILLVSVTMEGIVYELFWFT